MSSRSLANRRRACHPALQTIAYQFFSQTRTMG
jgi:hypothetical protein